MDDCGFAPFADDISMAPEVTFEKIPPRVVGIAVAAKALEVSEASVAGESSST